MVCVATTTTIQYTTETLRKMVGAHSRPPNPTGDHGHQQNKPDETKRVSPRRHTRVDERTTENVDPTGHTP
ncbi:hypothetical protein E2C01_067755 [Portunus trituberculatus]|uniref:Uncharacterized protein n=1 Tax=Portunus trituberculatus TaxID=210409 RepID=A0A5B7HVZ0_PORTR|nr:hypothetical protein [Portunus trituberculatus]